MRKSLKKEVLDHLVILLVDMQEYFVDTDEKERLIPNHIEVLKFGHRHNVPAIIVEYDGYHDTVSRLSAAIEKLYPVNITKIIKRRNDAFEGTQLTAILKSLGATHILIMGVNACACVYETANHALTDGFSVLTSRDLIAGYCGGCSRSNREKWYADNTCYPANYQEILEKELSTIRT